MYMTGHFSCLIHSIKCGAAKLVLWVQYAPISEVVRSCKCFPCGSKMSAVSHNGSNGIAIEKISCL